MSAAGLVRLALTTGLFAAPALAAPPVEGTRVVAATVRPADLVEEAELAELLELPVPGPWDQKRVDLTRENLNRTGRFAQVRVTTEEAPGGVLLVFEVTPRPWARRIQFPGKSQISQEKILTSLDFHHYEALGDGAVADAGTRIAELYEREGLPRPEVEPTTRRLGEDGATEVVFEIRETPLSRFAGISIAESGHGRWHYRLRLWTRMLWTRLGMRLRGANLVRLERLASREQRHLRSMGYADATVTASPTSGLAGEILALEITYGRRTTVKGDGLGRGVTKQVIRSWRARPRPLTDRVVQRFVDDATSALREKGYLEAEVLPRLEETEDEVKLFLEARRGPRSHVGEVVFEGNATVPDDELGEAAGIAAPRWLGLLRSRPGPEMLAESERVLEALHAAQGFPRARVTGRLAPGSEAKRTVVFAVEEGSRLWVGDVQLLGVSRFTGEEILTLLGTSEGDPYSRAVLRRGVAAVEEAYRGAGYAHVEVQAEAGRPDEQARVPVLVKVGEGVPAVCGPTIVRGAFKTRPGIIRRLHRQQRGEPFHARELARAQQRLNQLGAFGGVAIATPERDNAPPGEIASLITVRDAVTAFYEVGFDYNADRGFEVLGTIGDRNLLRRGLSGSLGGLYGSRRHSVSLNLTQPLLFGIPLTNFVRGAFADDQTNPSFKERRLGAEIGVEREIVEDLRVTVAYHLERQTPYDVEPDVDQELLPEEERVAGLNPTLTWEGRDDPFNARRGTYFTARLKSSRRALGAATSFDRLEVDWRSYRSLGPEVVIATALRVGHAEERQGDQLPLTERFFIGGASTHRGFHEKALGPRGEDGSPLGGESFLLGNVEIRLPLWGALHAGAFVDAGNVFLSGAPEVDLRWAAGVGLRFQTPVGPIRVDLGFNLDPAEGEDHSVLHIALGHAF